MKRQEKIDVLNKGINEIEICRCYFTYDDNYFYYYPNEVNEKFLLDKKRMIFCWTDIVFAKFLN